MGTNQRDQVKMDDVEIAEFLQQQRIGNLATIHATGALHQIAMWYAIVDGQIWIESKAKSQKIVNLQRDNRLSLLIESGLTYDVLRGVSIEGRGHLSNDRDDLWNVCVSIFERYIGKYSDSASSEVEAMFYKRVAVRVEVDRIRSWDHRKLGLERQIVAGSTAEFIADRPL